MEWDVLRLTGKELGKSWVYHNSTQCSSILPATCYYHIMHNTKEIFFLQASRVLRCQVIILPNAGMDSMLCHQKDLPHFLFLHLLPMILNKKMPKVGGLAWVRVHTTRVAEFLSTGGRTRVFCMSDLFLLFSAVNPLASELHWVQRFHTHSLLPHFSRSSCYVRLFS